MHNNIFTIGFLVCFLALGLIVNTKADEINSDDLSESAYNQYLIDSLKDKNIGIRASAAELLGQRRCEKAVKPLIGLLETDKEYQVRIIASLALHKIGGDQALKALRSQAKKEKRASVRHVLAGIVIDMENQYLAMQ